MKKKESPATLKVLFCASEVAPFKKTGGLADVVGSLPLALSDLGVRCLILMPKYRGMAGDSKRLGPRTEVRFIEHEEYFNRSGLYGNDRGDFPDNLQRFSFFCHEALETAKRLRFKPDIVHAHDWQAALLPVLLKSKYASDAFYAKTRSVMSIHNIAYQGQFSHKMYGTLGLDPSLYSVEGFECYGKINLLKAGVLFSDAVTTVSPTYAKEIQTAEFGFSLDGVMKSRAASLRGILNGLDIETWDPSSDKAIEANYSAGVPAGKKACKEALQKACGFETDPEVPLFVMVTRLAEQKGLELVSEIADRFLTQKVQFALLGEGDAVYHTSFTNIGKRHERNARMFLGFDAFKAHAMYAGADFFLMPSYFEPCGLGQMIAMRYGAIPVVRRTGGLADTVTDVHEDPETGNGFVFQERTPEKLWETVKRAMALFADKKTCSKVRLRGMRGDFSWTRSAKQYLELYRELAA